jgi:hypothetical protein
MGELTRKGEFRSMGAEDLESRTGPVDAEAAAVADPPADRQPARILVRRHSPNTIRKGRSGMKRGTMKTYHVVAVLALSVSGMLSAGCRPSAQAETHVPPQTDAMVEQTTAPEAAPRSQQDLASTEEGGAGTPPARGDDSNQAPEHRLSAALSPDMAYASFRARALAHGWKPLINPNCKLNMAGESDGRPYCLKFPDSASCKLCDDLPELVSYSNDLYSLMQFSHPEADTVLKATGWGEIESWRETGEGRAFVLRHWEFDNAPER